MWTDHALALGFVVLILAVVIGGAASLIHGSDAHPSNAQHQRNSRACFVTGTGNQLCGSAAAAYCSIHFDDYIGDMETDSISACLDAGYQPTESDKEQAWVVWDGSGEAASDPIGPPTNQNCLHSTNDCAPALGG